MVDVKLHDIGEGMTEGEVIHLFISLGDTVKVDEPLVEVQTDKMTAELPSPAAGTVKEIRVSQGDIIEVGTVMVVIDDGSVASKTESHETSETPQSASDASGEKSAEGERITQPDAKGPARILAAPHTRKLARSLNVPLEDVTGTGRLGRITDKDVSEYLENENGPISEKNHEQDISAQTNQFAESGYEEIPFIGRRRAIGKKMAQSLFTIPHVTHFDEADVTQLLAFKQSLKALDPDKGKGYNVSMASFFIKAIALALKEFPIFNARLDEENQVIRMEKAVHMGLATDTEDGLIVPVIKHAESKSLLEIQQDMKRLIGKAQTNKLTREDITGSTFTISNVGPLGSTGATPIINYPEVGLMAFHKTKKMPVVNENDEIVIRSMMNISMSFDHRVADGGKAVAFTNKVIELLQHPEVMMIGLR